MAETRKKKRKPRPVPPVETKEVEIPGTGVSMQARNERHQHSPPAKPYVFQTKLAQELAVGVNLGLNVMLTGPTGCGKTLAVEALASYLGHPFVRFNCDGETRVTNLRGMMKPSAEDGVLTLKFSEGALVHAMRHGYWVLLDEIDAALPSVIFLLQPVLEEANRALYVPETGKRVKAHPGFRVFATGNTVGYRAHARARHAGTNPLNDAFLDRFGMVIAVDYPTMDDERAIVKANCPDVDAWFVEAIIRVASDLRKDEKFKTDFSTRRCVQWARLAGHFDPEKAMLRAAELAVIRKLQSPTDAKVAREVICRVCGYSQSEFHE